MPFLKVQSGRLFYRLDGDEGNPVLVLSHSIGTDHGMWDPQVPDLLAHFRVLRYDTRGHGASEAPAGEYTIDDLGSDLLQLADALEIRKFAFCGLSLGGAIGQWIAIHAPERVTRLVLANTSPQFHPRKNWEMRMEAVRTGGIAAIAEMALSRFFSPKSLEGKNPFVPGIRSTLLGTNVDGYLGCCAALRDANLAAGLSQISAPTLVIVGESDVSTPWSGHAEFFQAIPGVRIVRISAAHLSNLERPRTFNTEILNFLLRDGSSNSDPLGPGTLVRRKVLGDAHVEKAMASVSELNRDFQELITRYAWGSIWSRPGLNHRTRRLLTLAITASLGRWEEFALHMRTGLEHELELCDLKEVLLQTAIYAGVPAGNTGFQMAARAIAESAIDENGPRNKE